MTKRKGGDKAEQVPKKQKAQPKEEPESEEASSEEEEKVVQTNGKKNGKAAPAPKATPKKEEKKDTKPAKKAEQTKKETKPAKQEKKPVKEDSDEDEDEEEEEEVKPPVKATKAKPAPKVEDKKGKQADNKKNAKKVEEEDDDDDDDDEDEEEEEKPKTKSTKPDTKNTKAAAKVTKKADDDDEEDEDEDEDEEEEEEKTPAKGKGKTEAKPAETGGLVMKSAAQGGLKIKGAPPPPVNTEGVESATIFIKNLPWSVTDEQIKELFSDCGTIKEIRWINDKQTGKFKGFGFVDFDSVDSAKQALKKNGEDVGGRPIKIDISTPKSGGGGGGGKPPREKVPGSRTVFIGKCPDSIEDDDIRALFKSAGPIESIRWVTDKMSGKFKGCGFVVFESTDSTDKAVAMNGSTVKGNSLRIDFADD